MKLFKEKNEEISLQESIENQIQTLLSNKLDRYWTYNFETNKLEGIHKVFEQKYLSDEFLLELSKVLPIFETRLCNVICTLIYQGPIPYLAINAKIKTNNQKIDTISINIQDL